LRQCGRTPCLPSTISSIAMAEKLACCAAAGKAEK